MADSVLPSASILISYDVILKGIVKTGESTIIQNSNTHIKAQVTELNVCHFKKSLLG
ncbi:hypothetical protein KJ966_15110 [bacterium]|nr:hypothetical protein [bacterium]